MELVGKYEILRPLASGGMGEVLLARQSGPGGFARAVVVKRLLPHLAKDPAFVQMFLNEARVVSRLSHPNVAQIYELGEADDTLFIAMEFVHGRSLLQVMRALSERGRLVSSALVARIAIEALQGLHHAHSLRLEGQSSPVVHRDMSPDNILIGFDGHVRVIDFGIARAADTVSTTRTGTVKGKFSYMAPERFDGERSNELDASIDVYAMGVVVYESLTGRRPFRGSSDAALIGAILNTEPPPAHEVNASVPQELSSLVARALAKDRTRRFASAAEFSGALEEWLRRSGQTAGEPELIALMRGLFGADAADVNPATSLATLPPVAAVPAPQLDAPTRTSPRPARRVGLNGAIAALTALVALGVATFWLSRAPEPVSGVSSLAVPLPVPQAPPPAPIVEPTKPVLTGKPGKVSFRVKPWGEIWLDDVKLGVTPNVSIERPPGNYTFVVKHPDWPSRSLPVQVLPESEVSVKVDLTTPP